MLPINVGRLMSDTSTNMNPEWTEQPKAKALPGAQLAAQREAMGLSVEQIADQLKLAPRQVVALEADDYNSLPNMAVTRGFVRAYAKVVKLDAAPLVAMIEVNPVAGHEHPQPVRREISASFTESRFPTMTERSGKPSGWLLGAAGVAVVAAAVGAYYVGLFPNLAPGQKDAAPAASVPAATPAIPVAPAGTAPAPLQSPNVPLISVAPPVDPNAPATAPAAQPAPQGVAPAAPAATAPAVAATQPSATPPSTPQATPPAAQPAAAPAPAGSTLVLTATEDSWITIQPPGKKALVSRMLKAGSTESFDVPEPALLIVGKPTHVKATLQGAALALPPVPGGTISRVNIK